MKNRSDLAVVRVCVCLSGGMLSWLVALLHAVPVVDWALEADGKACGECSHVVCVGGTGTAASRSGLTGQSESDR